MSDNSNNNSSTKKGLPLMTPQVAKMFGLPLQGAHLADNALPVPDNDGNKHFSQIVGNLYIKDQTEAQMAADASHSAIGDKSSAHQEDQSHSELGHNPETSAPAENKFLRFVKIFSPYVIVFSVAIFLYFFFFSQVDFGGLLQTKAQVQTPKQSEVAQLEQQDLSAYKKWISQFYFDVSDASLLDPEADNSGNGLTNFQKYLLNLNPRSYDTLGLGTADSQSLQAGINPLTGGQLTDAQKAIVDKYFDFEVISNRLALAHLQRVGEVAGIQTNSGANGMSDYRSFGQNGDPGASQSEALYSENLDINASLPGRLQITSLKVDAPLVWTQDTRNFDKDLQSGVVHYPGTAMPGQIGTTYISGHSSNYAWAKGSYNHVFTHLGDLANDTSFQITVTLTNGKTAVLHYVVVGRQEYSPTDQAQFKNTGKSIVALSTCWPVGSTAKRLVVFGQLTQIEK